MSERAVRAGCFLFDVDRFENDDVVVAMSPLARVHYLRLLVRLWKRPEPGVIADDDRLLASLSEAGKLWPRIKAEIKPAFDSISRPGLLVQQGLVRTHQAQTEWREACGRYGAQGAAKRWGGHRHPIATSREGMAGSGSGSGSVESNTPPPPSPPDGGSMRESPQKRPKKPKGPEAPPEVFRPFYAAYPRKEDPRAAARALRTAMERHPDMSAEDFAWAAGQYADQCRKEGREERHIKHPGPWLNADSFLKFFVEG